MFSKNVFDVSEKINLGPADLHLSLKVDSVKCRAVLKNRAREELITIEKSFGLDVSQNTIEMRDNETDIK